MKKITYLILVLVIMSSCGSRDKGELVGVKGKRWHPEKPYGMGLIPGGAFVMGKSDDDIVDLQDAPTKLLRYVLFTWMKLKSQTVNTASLYTG